MRSSWRSVRTLPVRQVVYIPDRLSPVQLVVLALGIGSTLNHAEAACAAFLDLSAQHLATATRAAPSSNSHSLTANRTPPEAAAPDARAAASKASPEAAATDRQAAASLAAVDWDGPPAAEAQTAGNLHDEDMTPQAALFAPRET